MGALSLSARILRELDKLTTRLNPDTASPNSSPLFGQAFFWQIVEARAKAKRKAVWDKLLSDGLVSRDDAGVIGNSASFIATRKVSNPSYRLDTDLLAEKLVEEHGWKIAATKQFIEDCKQPTKAPESLRVEERL